MASADPLSSVSVQLITMLWNPQIAQHLCIFADKVPINFTNLGDLR
jgi:hypothetical protein